MKNYRSMLAACLGLVLCAAAAAQPTRWVASWGAAQQVPEPRNELAAQYWLDATLRQIVHTSLGGTRLRVRISNAFGPEPLVLDGAGIARARVPGDPSIDAVSARALTFDGRAAVTIPAGAEYYSDAVALAHPPGADLAISLYFKAPPARQTGHPGSRATSFVGSGNRVGQATWDDAVKVEHWYALADVEVEAPPGTRAVVAVGDSITDGNGATTDANNRWPDLLAQRLRANGRPLGVVNAGIGGGRMLRDGLGPNLVSRFERDVLGRAGVSHAIVMIGVNDLGNLHRNVSDEPALRARLLEDLRLAYRQLVERAHDRGVCVLGGTITPYGASDYYKPGPVNEADRRLLNDWIRTSAIFDGVADFDAALRDPAAPHLLRKEFDKGDGLHPSGAGMRALAEAVPLEALRGCRYAPQGRQ
ncbi:SGNH/GDSL hydrolase family protein [[Empedobacter] haloabium]|uniref:SGNH/GDSL hydrolase family protein n=1 Tax=[Empedobacter] haloabium TaxID=592317 RepID=A0ABZ1UPW8_9BURK